MTAAGIDEANVRPIDVGRGEHQRDQRAEDEAANGEFGAPLGDRRGSQPRRAR
jgi:hypothetical protein